jgi:hypothetical protein
MKILLKGRKIRIGTKLNFVRSGYIISVFLSTFAAIPSLLFIWHLYLSFETRHQVETFVWEGKDTNRELSISVNPLSNLVTITAQVPNSLGARNAFEYIDTTLAKDVAKKFNPAFMRRAINAKANEQYDIYAMRFPYRIEFSTKHAGQEAVAKSGIRLEASHLYRESIQIQNHLGFIMPPEDSLNNSSVKPWVWYAPTLPGLPDIYEDWMFKKILAAGITIAGVDVGETYGSPSGVIVFTRFYKKMVENGYSQKPVLYGRSRGGLMALSWAEENPEKISSFAGVYPVSNIASYPGIEIAHPAFEMSAIELRSNIEKYNPVDRLQPLAKYDVPFFIIHGDRDRVVPLEENSKLLAARYSALEGPVELVIEHDQGHNGWSGFFKSQAMVDFILKTAAGK